MKVRLPAPLTCRRCQHVWLPRSPVVTICPRCKSRHWQTTRTDRRGLRSRTTRRKQQSLTRPDEGTKKEFR